MGPRDLMPRDTSWTQKEEDRMSPLMWGHLESSDPQRQNVKGWLRGDWRRGGQDRPAVPWPPPPLSRAHTPSCTRCSWRAQQGPGPVLSQSCGALSGEHAVHSGDRIQSTARRVEDSGQSIPPGDLGKKEISVLWLLNSGAVGDARLATSLPVRGPRMFLPFREPFLRS